MNHYLRKMELNKKFEKIEIESVQVATAIEKQIGIKIPLDYVEFREKFGGLFIDGVKGPALILDPINPNCAICGFYKFINFNDLKIEYDIVKLDEYGIYKNVNKNKLLRIGYCEGQYEIYIGYGDDNYNQIFLYLVEDGDFRAYGTLENFINNWIVEYDEKYF